MSSAVRLPNWHPRAVALTAVSTNTVEDALVEPASTSILVKNAPVEDPVEPASTSILDSNPQKNSNGTNQ